MIIAGQPSELDKLGVKPGKRMSESDIQKAVFAALKKRGVPGVISWHVPNDKSSRRKAGFRKGVSDVNLFHRSTFYALELKTEEGNPSVEQMEFVSEVNRQGGFATIVGGLDKALRVLEMWGLLRPEVRA